MLHSLVGVWQRLLALVRRGRIGEEIDDEIAFHIAMRRDELEHEGVPTTEADRQARRQFGNVTRLREDTHETWTFPAFESLVQDVRIGGRTLRRRPGFALSVILTLAIGIGANVAVFSVVHAVLIRPFAYPAYEPDRVLLMAERSPLNGRMGVAYPTFRDWVEQLESFESLSGFMEYSFILTGTQLDDPIRARALITSSTYFGIHGINALFGRLYDATDDQFGAARVAVLSHPLWQNVFGGRTDVIGETIGLRSGPATIIGVLPPGVDLHPGRDVYTPLEPVMEENEPFRDRGLRMINNADGLRTLYVHGRLKAGVTFEQARAELTATAARFETQYPETNAGVGVIVDRLNEWRLRSYRTLLLTLQVAVLFLWLIATTNVANLMLARAVTRRRQYAVSAALGAGSVRTMRPLFVENLMLSLTAGGGGLLIALGVVQLVRTMTPFDVPRLADAQLNGPVATLGLSLAILAGLVAGLLPGLRVARRVDVMAVLNEDGPQARAGGGGRRLHRGLLVTEIALATLLLVMAGALIRTVADLTRVDPGFHNDRILTARIRFGGGSLGLNNPREITAMFQEVRRRVEALPEVLSVGLAHSLPLIGASGLEQPFMAADQPVPAVADRPMSADTPADEGYFDTMGIPLLEGRYLVDTDRSTSDNDQRVVVVTETLARNLWPTESALGKRLILGSPDSPRREIVGVVGALRQDGLDAEPRPQTFRPFSPQLTFIFGTAFVARTTGDPLSIVEPVRAAIKSAYPTLLVSDVRSMDDLVATQMAPRRFVMWTLGLFGLIAILIAAVGIHGVLAHAVAQRAHELGIRMALGADRRTLRSLVMREGVVTALVGVLVGSAGSLAAMRLLESLLLPQTAADPWLWMLVPLFVIAVALVSSFIPSNRAARTDPIVALRGV